ncbi:hypothetical protein HK100_010427 [Physocladia obscura]|uniref:Uncharacterized protein n=1 Tax=Physocladia obscura TaxID=109957 RepID=A0AAD5T306_9FUNG|nr:hypothetical protein HK100_010427 [Physocladia obscura]
MGLQLLQTGLAGLLLGIFATEIAQGVHNVIPYLVLAFGNTIHLKNKISGTQRTDILTTFRVLASAPLWFWSTILGAWALLVCLSLFNAVSDKKIARVRATHAITFICAIGCAVPPVLKRASPLLRLFSVSVGRSRLSSAEELVVLYDIGFIVAIDAALLAIAFVANLSSNESPVVPKRSIRKVDNLNVSSAKKDIKQPLLSFFKR